MKILGKKNNFLGIGKDFSSYDKSAIAILSFPLEKTVSYGKGAAKGPRAILKASHYVEFYDEELDREICFEKGIATLPSGDYAKLPLKKALDKIYLQTKKIIEDGKFVVSLGGEHTVSFPIIKAHKEKYNEFTVLQIDAHSDLRDSYEGTKYSHACVMARVAEFTEDIVQVGIRAQCKEEADFIKRKGIKTFYARQIREGKYGKNWQRKIVDSIGEKVYITFDVDGFDPSLLPATGTPEPGGLFWDETLNLLKLVAERKEIIGFDVVELAPSKAHPASEFIAAKLVYKLINYAFMRK